MSDIIARAIAFSVKNNLLNGINQAVASGAASTTVTFTTTQADANYALVITPGWPTVFSVAKTNLGFTVTWSTAPTVAQTFDWLLYR